jgi:hypothetical protein
LVEFGDALAEALQQVDRRQIGPAGAVTVPQALVRAFVRLQGLAVAAARPLAVAIPTAHLSVRWFGELCSALVVGLRAGNPAAELVCRRSSSPGTGWPRPCR